VERQKAIQSGTCVLLASLFAAPDRVWARNQEALYKPLIDTLLQINSPVTRRVANRLKDTLLKCNSYNMHLRSSSLDASDAGLIAKALSVIHDNQHFKLMSLNVSYNSDISGLGVGELLNALPNDTPELGLIGCNLGDNASTHIVGFIQRSKRLWMVCVKDTHFSNRVKVLIRGPTKRLFGRVTIVLLSSDKTAPHSTRSSNPLIEPQF
jgi:hypothetical protein